MRRSIRQGVVCIIALGIALLAGSSWQVGVRAQEPAVAVGYQGYLCDALGEPISETVKMQFRLFNSPSGGTSLWDSGVLDVAVDDGFFSVSLGASQSLFTGRELWLATYVAGQTLSPRQKVLAVPYAAGLLPGAQVVGQSDESTLAAVNGGNGAGLRGSSAKGAGVYGYSDQGYAVYGENTGSVQGKGYGGYFVSSTGTGIYGLSTAPIASANPRVPGVQGHSLNGVGVYGTSDSATLAGVSGLSQRGIGVEGTSPEGTGLRGGSGSGTGIQATSQTGTGARVESGSGVGLEVVANGEVATAHALTASARAGRALVAQSERNAAIWGRAGDTSGIYEPTSLTGVVGQGQDRGVFGGTTMGSGVEGMSQSGAGVRGRSVSGYGGYFVSDWRGLYAESLSGTGYDAWFGGELGIRVEGTVEASRVKVNGEIIASGAKSGYVVDIAQNAGAGTLEAGDVVEIIGVAEPLLGEIPVPLVRKAEVSESTAVMGVVDEAYEAPGAVVGPGDYLKVVTLGCFRAIKVDAQYGAIAPGTLLVSSPTAGHAMRAAEPKPGAVIGKALGSQEGGTGIIPVMVTLQ